MSTSKNALAILSKYPKPGHAKTRLSEAVGKTVASRIAELFLVDLLRRVMPMREIRIVLVGSASDKEKDFKKLLAKHHLDAKDLEIFIPRAGSLLEDITATYTYLLKGSRKVVVTGSDIPYISRQMIRTLFKTLDEYDLVFHPNPDGTVLPHGMKKPTDLFTGLNTRSPIFFVNWFLRVKSVNLSYKMLEPLFDIDMPQELYAFYGWQLCLEDTHEEAMICPATLAFLRSLLK